MRKLLYFLVLVFPGAALSQDCGRLSDEYQLWAEKTSVSDRSDPFPGDYRASSEIYNRFKKSRYYDTYFSEHLELKEKFPELRNEDIVALTQYVRSGFNDVNSPLRNQQISDIPPAELDFIRVLVSALNKLPHVSAQVYRFASYTPEKINQQKTAVESDEVIVERSFLSTSLDSKFEFDGTVKYEINTKLIIDSFSGVRVRDFSGLDYEDEVLLKPHRRFRVLKVIDKGKSESNFVEIYLKEVP